MKGIREANRVQPFAEHAARPEAAPAAPKVVRPAAEMADGFVPEQKKTAKIAQLPDALVSKGHLALGSSNRLPEDSVIFDRTPARQLASAYLKVDNDGVKVIHNVPEEILTKKFKELSSEEKAKIFSAPKIDRDQRSRLQDVFDHLAKQVAEKPLSGQQLEWLKYHASNAYDSQDKGRGFWNGIRRLFSSKYRQHRAEIDKSYKRFTDVVNTKSTNATQSGSLP